MSEHLPTPDNDAAAHSAGAGIEPTEPRPVTPESTDDPTTEIIAIEGDELEVSAEGLVLVAGRAPSERELAKIEGLEHTESVNSEGLRLVRIPKEPTGRTRTAHFNEHLSSKKSELEIALEQARAEDGVSEATIRELEAAVAEEQAEKEAEHEAFMDRVRNSLPPDHNLRPVTRQERAFRKRAEKRRREIGELRSGTMFGLEQSFGGTRIGNQVVTRRVWNAERKEFEDKDVLEPIIDNLVRETGDADPGDGSSVTHTRFTRRDAMDVVIKRYSYELDNDKAHKVRRRTNKELREEADATFRYVQTQLKIHELEEEQGLDNLRFRAKVINARSDAGLPISQGESSTSEAPIRALPLPEHKDSTEIVQQGIKGLLFREPYIDQEAIDSLSPEERAELEASNEGARLAGLFGPAEVINSMSDADRQLLYLTVELRMRSLGDMSQEVIAQDITAKPIESISESDLNDLKAMTEDKGLDEKLRFAARDKFLDVMKVTSPKDYMELLPIMDLGRYYAELLQQEIDKGHGPGDFRYDTALMRLQQVVPPEVKSKKGGKGKKERLDGEDEEEADPTLNEESAGSDTRRGRPADRERREPTLSFEEMQKYGDKLTSDKLESLLDAISATTYQELGTIKGQLLEKLANNDLTEEEESWLKQEYLDGKPVGEGEKENVLRDEVAGAIANDIRVRAILKYLDIDPAEVSTNDPEIRNIVAFINHAFRQIINARRAAAREAAAKQAEAASADTSETDQTSDGGYL